MTLKEFKNRTSDVNARFLELGELLVKLKAGEEVDFNHILDLVKQSHTNEINLIDLIADIQENDGDIDEVLKFFN